MLSSGFNVFPKKVLWLFWKPFVGKTWCFWICPLVFKDSGYTLDNMPEWRNGRRTRLKIWHPFGYTGSTPVSGISFASRVMQKAYGSWLMAHGLWLMAVT